MKTTRYLEDAHPRRDPKAHAQRLPKSEARPEARASAGAVPTGPALRARRRAPPATKSRRRQERETVLVTGAAGYLGSHTCVALMDAGYDVVGVDNFCNSHPAVLDRIAAVAGRPLRFHEGDVLDPAFLASVFASHPVQGVVHFAGLKAVGESVARPLHYYQTNVGGSLALARAMANAGVGRLVFSSSATVYGQPDQVPVTEDAGLRPSNPYGHSKAMAEQVLQDAATAHPEWSVLLLRYFNPTGAHPSGLMGEDPAGIPNNLMPFLTQVAIGRRAALDVFGNDYATPDGTGVRDYIHVMDLARGHVAALRATATRTGCLPCNLGTGRGYSVLELVKAFRKASGHPVPVRYVARRSGDIATTFADASRAFKLLGWKPEFTLADMCRDAWHWQSTNPAGYGDAAAPTWPSAPQTLVGVEGSATRNVARAAERA